MLEMNIKHADTCNVNTNHGVYIQYYFDYDLIVTSKKENCSKFKRGKIFKGTNTE